MPTITEILNPLSDNEQVALIEWLETYPTSLPKDDVVVENLVIDAKRVASTGYKVTLESLNLAARKAELEYQKAKGQHDASMKIITTWSNRRETTDWPVEVPTTTQSLAAVVKAAQALGGISERNLDQALLDLQYATINALPETRTFQSERGLTAQNVYDCIGVVLGDASLKTISRRNLDVALQILVSQGKITNFTKTKVESTQSAAPLNLPPGSAASQDMRGGNFGAVTKKAIEDAQKAVFDIYQKSDASQRAQIDRIREAVGNTPDAPLVVFHEMDALREVMVRFNNPPTLMTLHGANHSERNEVRERMREIIEWNQDNVKRFPEQAKAMWTAILRTFQDEIDPLYNDRSIR
jgi:hypothetical protein